MRLFPLRCISGEMVSTGQGRSRSNLANQMKEKIQEFGGWALKLTWIGLKALKEYHHEGLSLYAIESVDGTAYYFKEGEKVTETTSSYKAAKMFCEAAWSKEMS